MDTQYNDHQHIQAMPQLVNLFLNLWSHLQRDAEELWTTLQTRMSSWTAEVFSFCGIALMMNTTIMMTTRHEA